MGKDHMLSENLQPFIYSRATRISFGIHSRIFIKEKHCKFSNMILLISLIVRKKTMEQAME